MSEYRSLYQHFLDQINGIEDAARRKPRWLHFGSTITTTREAASGWGIRLTMMEDRRVIKENVRMNAIVMIFVYAAAAVPMGVVVWPGFKQGGYFISVSIGGTVFMLLLGIAFYLGVRDSGRRQPITLTLHDITIDGKTHVWTDISETFIVSRPREKSSQDFLVLGFQSGAIRYFELDGKLGWMRVARFAAMIEWYRNRWEMGFSFRSLLFPKYAPQFIIFLLASDALARLPVTAYRVFTLPKNPFIKLSSKLKT